MKLVFHIVFLSILSITPSFAQKGKTVTPLKKKAITLISGRQLNYYNLDKKKPITYHVAGFEKVVVYSRIAIGDRFPKPYSIAYSFDNETPDKYQSGKIKVDYKTMFFDKSLEKKVAKFYKKEINLPKGSENLSLRSANGKHIAISVLGYNNGKRFVIKPTVFDENSLLLSGKLHKYYKLNSKIATRIKLPDMGELIVYTRMRLDDKTAKKYDFSYRMGKSKYNKILVEDVKTTTNTLYKSSKIEATPSTVHKTTIKITDPSQVIQFASEFPVDARFVFVKSKEKHVWKKVETSSKASVVLVSKKSESERVYHRIDNATSFDFLVNTAENTMLKVFVRGEFTYDMISNNDYEIILKDHGKMVNTYKLSCERSKEMNYKNDDELIPGSLDKIYIDVPKGQHKYSFSIQNKGKSALLRVVKKD